MKIKQNQRDASKDFLYSCLNFSQCKHPHACDNTLVQISMPLRQFTNPMLLLHPTSVFNLISEIQLLYHNLPCNYRIPCYWVCQPQRWETLISKQPVLFSPGIQLLTCNELPQYDSQAWFPALHILPTLTLPSPHINKLPQREKLLRGRSGDISASLNSAHVPTQKH